MVETNFPTLFSPTCSHSHIHIHIHFLKELIYLYGRANGAHHVSPYQDPSLYKNCVR